MVGGCDEVDIVSGEVVVVRFIAAEETEDVVWVVIWSLDMEFGGITGILSSTSTSVSSCVGCVDL